jgi:hypothetical protein
MSKQLLLAFAAGAITLAAAACAAVAAPLNPGSVPEFGGNHAGLVPVHMGGGGGFHGGGFGGFHGGFGSFHGHAMGGPHFASRGFGPRAHFYGHNSHFAHDFRHRNNRFFFAGYPYYDDYYDDDYYDSACWWSGRYHRWVCPDY